MDTSLQSESDCDFQMESHRMVHRFPKRERVFNCADPVESLKCLQCTNFQTHKLVDLAWHFIEGHTLSEKEDTVYCCENCNFHSYSNYLNLRHKLFNLCKGNCTVKSEETTEYFQCDSCEFRTPLKSALNRHFTKKHKSHKGALRKCEHCPCTTKNRKALKRHILLNHTDPDKVQWFKCEHCPYKSQIRANFKSHVDYKHGKTERVKCDFCSFEAGSKCNLQRHVLVKHTDPDKLQWFECEHCPFKTKMKSYLRKHIKCKHDRIEFRCDPCQFKAKSNRGLQAHMIHKHSAPDEIQWFECEECPYTSPVKDNLRRHLALAHGDSLKCEQCEFTTKWKKSLASHMSRKHRSDQ